MANPWVKRCWCRRTPLEPDASPGAVAFWIEQAARDPWTHDDLTRLIESALAGDRVFDLPADVILWGLKRHPRPRQHGPASDPWRDLVIWGFVEMLSGEEGPMSQTAAFEEIGRVLRKSAKTIESARRRAMILS